VKIAGRQSAPLNPRNLEAMRDIDPRQIFGQLFSLETQIKKRRGKHIARNA